MRRLLAAGVCVAALLLAAGPVRAQSASPAAERRQEDVVRARLDPDLALLRSGPRAALDWGLWMNHLFIDYRNDDNARDVDDQTDHTFSWDTRLWIRAMWRLRPGEADAREHSVYLRLKDQSTWRAPDDAHGSYDHDGPHADQAFLSLDLRPWLIQAGRRYYSVGQGIAYSDVHDGAEALLTLPRGTVMGFVSRTLPYQENIDLSLPGGKRSGRTFFAMEGKYLGIRGHSPYAYLLAQHDAAQEDPDGSGQDYGYESRYLGLGLEGTLVRHLRYAAEWIGEGGTSMTSGANERRRVRAMAVDVSGAYDVQTRMQPTLFAEYAFGSGDPDRGNITDTVNGNLRGRDTNFLYFGYLPTGYALSPRLSNLQLFRIGAAAKPLEGLKPFTELTVRMDWYAYRKQRASGAVSDTEATAASRDLGTELDVSCSWPVVSDVTVAFEYGHFWPGDAYPVGTRARTVFLSASVVTTF